jgi:hypothetical protein
MYWLRYHFLCGLLCLLPSVGAAADPLRLVPAEADLVIRVPQPRRVVEAARSFPLLDQLRHFEAVAELRDSTNARRLNQLVAYFEKQLGMSWPDAVDRLAGGGIAVALKFGTDPAPALLVVQGTDEALVQQFAKTGLNLIEQELARQETKDRRQEGKHRGVPTTSFGKDFHAAVVGAAILVSNKESALHRAIDLHVDGPAKSLMPSAAVAEAGKLLPPEPLVSLWVNLEPAHKAPQAKDIFDLPNGQPLFTVLFGGWIDVVKRAPFLCAGVYREGGGFRTVLRLPRGREGMPAVVAAHTPPPEQAGALPLLEPPGVLYSTSYYLDVSKFLEHRKQLLNSQLLKSFEDFDKNSGRFLMGNRFAKLVGQIGPHQRVVVANQQRTTYPMQPEQRIPAFALVVEARDPATFAKSMEAILRGAAFLASTQTKLQLVEEKHGDFKIIGYRFAQDGQLKGDEGYLRFNYSPCFVAVGNQFVACSTLELCHQLVDLLQKEVQVAALVNVKQRDETQAKLAVLDAQINAASAELAKTTDRQARSRLIAQLQQLDKECRTCTELCEQLTKSKPSVAHEGDSAAVRSQFYALGGAELLQFNEDQLFAQTILNQALAPEAAKQQVKSLIDLVKQLGVLRLVTTYGANDFRFEIEFSPQGHEEANRGSAR